MAVEIQSTAPANASFDYASSKYTATIGPDGDVLFVSGYSRNFVWTSARMGTTFGDPVEAHWIKFGADVTTSVAITKISGPISTFKIYPRGVVTSAALDADGDGILLIEVPTNTRLRIEIDGDVAEPLHIFAEPVKSAIPANRTDWTSLRLDVSSVDGGADTITFAAPHGLSGGERLVFQQDAGEAATVLTGNGLVAYQAYVADVVDTTTIGLLDVNGDAVDLSGGGSKLFYAVEAGWTDTVNSLYFPDGVHVIGKMFPLADDVEVYLERGAVLIGGFDMRRKNGIVVRGPGTISGEHTAFETEQNKSLAIRLENAFFNGYPEDDYVCTNTLAEVTMFAGAHFSVVTCFYSITNIQLISFWTANTDGLIGMKNPTTSTITITDCFVFSGDDCIHLNAPATVNVSGCFVVGVGASCMHLGYKPNQGFNASYSVNVSDCDLMALSVDYDEAYGFPSGFPIRAHMDALASQSALGYYNVNFTDIRIWGQIDTEAISLWNVTDPWVPTAQQGEQGGQAAFWAFENIAIEEVPAELSRIWGLNLTNTPHDIAFSDFYVAGTKVTADNFETYFQVNDYPYNITWDDAGVIIPPDPPEPPIVTPTAAFVVEDGTARSDANSYCSVAVADIYHQRYGNPAAWSGATTAVKQEALRIATRAADERYGLRWSGIQSTGTQALAWPRNYATDLFGREISSTAVPTALQNWVARAALLHIGGTTLIPDTQTEAVIASETKAMAGGFSKAVTYRGGKSPETQFPSLDRSLMAAGLIEAGAGWGYADA